MPRNLPHFLLKDLGKPHPFQAKGGGSGKKPSDVLNRSSHAQALLQAIDQLPAITSDGLPGVYLEIKGRPGEPLAKDSLGSSGIELLRSAAEVVNGSTTETATVFATAQGVEKLRKKIEKFETEDTPDREKDGELIPGRPKNANLVQSLAAITEAGLRALWRGPQEKFHADNSATHWEIWLEPSEAEAFIAQAAAYQVQIGADRLQFPEDVVVIGLATRDHIALAVRRLGSVRALAAPAVTADFFDALDVLEQTAWVQDLVQRITYAGGINGGYVTLLDTGVSRAHPLIAPVLLSHDRHVADPAWGLDDIKGHGTQLAGLSLFGDLTLNLQSTMPITVSHRLESVKLIPDGGPNPHHLLGVVTRRAINIVEQTVRRRTFTMAVTTDEDTPHDGAPTSWSTEIDQLAAGVSGDLSVPRLILISAGNTNNFTFAAGHYLDTCDLAENEIESPAQAWNAISVGAYTEKTMLPPNEGLASVAPFGDLSPSSRTASWTSTWPLKPDIVLEGGNWAAGAAPPPMRHGWLSLLTTHHAYPQRSFSFTHDTSAATAIAAKQITELWSDYPLLWPETIRALYVASARWTPQMRSHLPANSNKGSYARLFQRYGYGVPDLERAHRSASNALTLIVQDAIVPYGLSEQTGGDVHKEMRLFTLPWPVEELRKLGNANVTLRVALSSFVAPNPAEASRGSRYRYASHNLRFKLNRAGENAQQFMARISKAVEPVGPQVEEEDLWDFGSIRRDVGSLHIDQLTCRASDLARRNLLAIHPVAGWWKSKKILEEGEKLARFALVVEIDTQGIEADLYTEVQASVAVLNAAQPIII